jgi:hypothetical protein
MTNITTYKRLIFLSLLFLGCTKQEPECWICTEKWFEATEPKSKSWEVCDVLEAAELNGKTRVVEIHLTGGAMKRTIYKTECE